jgi:hypothetical protein
MKKTHILLATLALLMVPFTVLAAVDITLRDISTEESKAITVNIDTQTDSLERVVLPITFSDGVDIINVSTGTINCSSLEYTETSEVENIVTITCELEEAIALDGVLASILFSSDDDNYSFELAENDDLEIGGLFLGDTINIEPTTDLITDNTDEDEEGITLEEDMLITTQEVQPTDVVEEEGFNLDNITQYLPYILIGASVILLISIVAILLGKKKGSKGQKPPVDTPTKESDPQSPVENTQKEESASPLKDMVNSTGKTKEPTPPPTPKPTTPPPSPEPTTPPPTPKPATPPPTIPPVPPAQPSTQQPPVQKTASPNIPPKTQEDDLKEILKREGSGMQTTPDEQEIQKPSPQPTQMPFSQDVNVNDSQMQETTPQEVNTQTSTSEVTPVSTPEDLQAKINSEINQISTNTPPQTPTTTPSNEYPPVPPSAVKQPQTNQDSSEEESVLPPPPTM